MYVYFLQKAANIRDNKKKVKGKEVSEPALRGADEEEFNKLRNRYKLMR